MLSKYRLDSKYNITAWLRYSQYNLHMYGWFALSWADEKNKPILLQVISRLEIADIEDSGWDARWFVNTGSIILGVLGL